MSEILLLVRIAFRNLFANFMNLVIGGIILVGTLLFVVGGSILGSVDEAMSKSIVGSIAGHLQVYSSKSKDGLQVFGSWTQPDLGAIPDFSQVRPALEAVPNVEKVIPMGTSTAEVMYGNTLDLVLEKLRKAVTERQLKGRSAELDQRIASLKSHLRQVIGVIQADYKRFAELSTEESETPEAGRMLAKALSPAFWSSFDSDPLNHLEFLENQIAYLLPDADMMFLTYVGTNLDEFRGSFDRMEIVDGEMIPKGRRGILISKYMYEDQMKLRIARRLDKLHEALTQGGKKIALDPDLQSMVKQNKTQTREIILQLDPATGQRFVAALQGYLKSKDADLKKLLSDFLDVNDSNLEERHQFFYDKLAPMLELYRLKPGDTIAIKSFTKSGFVQTANLRIYGTFQFKGLEKSGLAGGVSLMDMMSFRDLYGFVTPEKIAESEGLKKAAGSTFVSRDNAEAELFGGGSTVSEAKIVRIDDQKELGQAKAAAIGNAMANRSYTKEEIEKGMTVNAAIILKDPSKIDQTMKAIERVSEDKKLDLKVVNWQTAAGDIGNFVFIAKAVLYFAVAIIFIVALVIINNAVMMATLQRIREIGTMRAIGAQRAFVLTLVVVETVVLGLVFGSIGTTLGSLIINWIGNVGIPAGNDFLYFFFAGPRLHPELGMGSLIGAFVVIFIVTSVSALYPAIVATRVSPLQAMQTEE